ncbi:MAG: CaiB/BaiF CoA transferase family protein [Candidatus Kariarchaeaceae archaeon]|jgi:crotonobetainyl-CoA:carnitine CoA-transferase CaiB-like acyl-CoA transferase
MFNRWDLLKDVKILDLSRIYTGPYCSQVLSDLGATVIKVEPPQGDDTRHWGPPFVTPTMSTYFAALNRNKESITLNLKDTMDYAKLEKLVTWADVVLENFSPGVTSRLEVDYKTLSAINPGLIYLTITGYGSSGPYAHHASYDIIAQSESGIMGVTGTEGGEITKPGVPIGDISGALYGAIGLLAALHYRNRTGKGQYLETTLFGSLNSWLTYQTLNAYFKPDTPPKPMGTAHPNIVPYQSFTCKDGQWISLSVGNEPAWERFVDLVQDDRLAVEDFRSNANRVTNRSKLIPLLDEIFASRTGDDWIESLQEKRIAVGKVNTIQQVLDHPQLEYTGQKHHVSVDDTTFPLLITPLSFSEARSQPISAPPKKNASSELVDSILRG